MHKCMYGLGMTACTNTILKGNLNISVFSCECMYNVYMSFPQIRRCYIDPLHQLGICHNNFTVHSMYVCMYVPEEYSSQ